MNLHQDKPTNPTFKKTTAILEKKKNIGTITRYMPFQRIFRKSPDVYPINFCGLGILKRVFSKRTPTTIDGLWKIVEEEW